MTTLTDFKLKPIKKVIFNDYNVYFGTSGSIRIDHTILYGDKQYKYLLDQYEKITHEIQNCMELNFRFPEITINGITYYNIGATVKENKESNNYYIYFGSYSGLTENAKIKLTELINTQLDHNTYNAIVLDLKNKQLETFMKDTMETMSKLSAGLNKFISLLDSV